MDLYCLVVSSDKDFKAGHPDYLKITGREEQTSNTGGQQKEGQQKTVTGKIHKLWQKQTKNPRPVKASITAVRKATKAAHEPAQERCQLYALTLKRQKGFFSHKFLFLFL